MTSLKPEVVEANEHSSESGVAGARAIRRGVIRLLRVHGFECAPEITLGSGRRADILGIGRSGEIVIVEIKSSVADFSTDKKWIEYRDYCDRFFFAVDSSFPATLIPAEIGLIVADSFGGDIIREAQAHPVVAARRKTVLTAVARVACQRLARANDPYAEQAC